jgi:aspartate ammonia-lyase
MNKKKRVEKDSLGDVSVPEQAYYGAQTVRAQKNFPISGLRNHEKMLEAMILIKKAAAQVNAEMGRLEKKKAGAIVKACDEVLSGKFKDQFILDVFQMGAGTSFHMNCNEVLANRAEEIRGGVRGQYLLVHPNDHVNMGQSTNDVFPTAMRIASLFLLKDLLEALKDLEGAFRTKAREFEQVLKSGRTHLQDAAPVRLGQEFRAYSVTLGKCRAFLERSSRSLFELGIGGSAVGTGLNTPAGYADRMVELLSRLSGLPLKKARDLREAMQSMRPMTEVSAALRNVAVEMNRIANDLRLLSSGPRTGLSEITLPGVAPGSSIMPGKVNPSMLEMMNMVCFQVLGSDQTVCAAAQAGQLELNVMMPVIAYNMCFMTEILTNAFRQLKRLCIDGIQADVARCREFAEKSMGLVVALTPHIGYLKAADVARKALEKGKPLAEIIEAEGLLSPDEIRSILDPQKMTEPNLPPKKS